MAAIAYCVLFSLTVVTSYVSVSSTTMTSCTSLSSIAVASHTAAPTLQARVFIPTIGNEPSSDPFVWVCFGIFIFMIVLAVILLTWTQWRSAREVWASVKKDEVQFRYLRNSSRFPADSERPSWDGSSQTEQGLVRISHMIPMADSECGSDTDSDDGEISAEEGDALATVEPAQFARLSDSPNVPLRHLTRTPPASILNSFEDVYDQFQASNMLDAEDADLGVTSNQRISMSERQFGELHLHGN